MKTRKFEETLIKVGYSLILIICAIVTYSIISFGICSTSFLEI
jgi:hypothetical protein